MRRVRRMAELVVWFEVRTCWFNELGFAVDSFKGYYPTSEEAHFHSKKIGKYYNKEAHDEYKRRKQGPVGYFITEVLVVVEEGEKSIGFIVDNTHNVRLNRTAIKMHQKVVTTVPE